MADDDTTHTDDPADTPTDDQKSGDQTDDKSGDKAPKTFDEGYVKNLRSESAGYRTRAVAAEKSRDEYKAKVEEYEKNGAGFEGRALDAEATLLKYRVAAAKGVPLSHAERLRGATKEEIEADASEFLKDFAPSNTDFDQGNKGKPPAGEVSPSEALRRLARK